VIRNRVSRVSGPASRLLPVLCLVAAAITGCRQHRSILSDPETLKHYGVSVSDHETLVLQASNWEKPEPAAPGTPQGDLQIAEYIFRDQEYAKAAQAFTEVAEKHKDTPPVHERALFMKAESEYEQGLYADARDSYEEFRKAYPGSRLVPQAMERLFAISDTWLEDARKDVRRGRPSTIHRFFNFEPERKPLFDIDGHAIETLKYVRDNDPNGPLADDSLMMSAGYYFTMGDYREAENATDQLIHSYPHSEHQAEAHLMNAEAKIQSYKGASYDGHKLEEARRTLRAAATQFPDQLEPQRQRIIREMEEIRQEQAKAQFEVAEWYRHMGDLKPKESDKLYRAARLYYNYVQRSFPGTKWADRAAERAAELPQSSPPEPQTAQETDRKSSRWKFW
jgi:outer membrane protein assembly factor BamD (BamD/ComL family)